MRGIKQLARDGEAEPVQIASGDEFQELGEAFNHMSAQLARQEEIRRSLVADVAHELRTPLTILQGKLESIQEGAAEPSEQVILELTDEVYRHKKACPGSSSSSASPKRENCPSIKRRSM